MRANDAQTGVPYAKIPLLAAKYGRVFPTTVAEDTNI